MTIKKIIGLVLGIVFLFVFIALPAPQSMLDVLIEGPPADPEAAAAAQVAGRKAMVYIGLFAMFLSFMITGVTFEAMIALLIISLLAIFKLADLNTIFAPFHGNTVWLVIPGFGIAAALQKCGLLKRIAFAIMQFFPENYRGQVMSIYACGVVMSPLLPSISAKALLMAPLSATVAKELGFEKSSKGAAGLFSASFMSSWVLGNAFFTGSLFVFIMMGFIPQNDQAAYPLDWISWFKMTWIWFLVMAILGFISVLLLFKPEKELTMEKGFAKKQLQALGPMSRVEKVTLAILALAIIGWILQRQIGVDASITAIVALALMALFGDFNVTDLRTKIPWETAVLIGGIMSIANFVSLLKIDKWLGAILGPALSPIVGNIWLFVPALCVIIYVLRYAIVSQIATGTMVIAFFIALTSAVGINTAVLAFVTFVGVQVWNLSFHNTGAIGAIAATGGDMIEHKDIVASSYAFMAVNLIAMTASIPLWKILGLVP
ncbi:MAG: anion permease [Gracilibacteraceae bacterium]|jgi:DASS family divalent anion:Na+ symporter|nr:anion permease [Gracilibacteraceae bacterium]